MASENKKKNNKKKGKVVSFFYKRVIMLGAGQFSGIQAVKDI